jgi:hypothetical protein
LVLIVREHTRMHNAISCHQRRDNAMATLFFIIIAFFLLCHSGKFALNFFEIFLIFTGQKDARWPLWAFLMTRINHLMLVINSSVNFFIYSFRDAKFRNALFSLLGLDRLALIGRSNSRETANGCDDGEEGMRMVHTAVTNSTRTEEQAVTVLQPRSGGNNNGEAASMDKNGNAAAAATNEL